MLEQAGIPVERKLNLGATDIAQAALVKGDISLYPEYTGTGLLVVLGYTGTTVTDPQKVYSMVQDGYKPFNLTWLDQSPMNDSQGLATTQAIADKYGIKTLSDLSTKANNLILAADPGVPGPSRRPAGAAKDLWRLPVQGRADLRHRLEVPGAAGRQGRRGGGLHDRRADRRATSWW